MGLDTDAETCDIVVIAMQVFWMRVLSFVAKRLFKKIVLYMPDGSAAPMVRGGVLLTNDEWYAEQVDTIQ